MMAKASEKRVLVKLRSTAGTGCMYVTTKNRHSQQGRLELRKYDRKIRKHVLFREER
ncbi:MAG: 50S ribosomal protein L33 [Actinomycetota bacterium]